MTDLYILQYNFERRKFAQELIAFDKWYEAGFSTKARSVLFADKENKPAEVPTEPFEYVSYGMFLVSYLTFEFLPGLSSLSAVSRRELVYNTTLQ